MGVFYDTHAHLDYPDFGADLPQVIERAIAAGITKIISIGTDFDSSARAIKLADRFPGVFAVVGWHPCDALRAPDDVRPRLRELARHPKVVAIGETGLDYHHLPDKRPGDTGSGEHHKRRQAEIFQQQLEVAAELGLNCVVHQRDSFKDTFALMEQFAGRVRGVFHCFANDAVAMQRVINIGSLVSFTGIVTFKNARTLRDTLAATPLDRFMLETDCPYLAPTPYRGKRCEPAYVRQIAELVAEVKDCPLDELSRKTCATAGEFFSKLSEGT